MIDLTTKVGVSIGEPDRPQHVAVVREPSTGAMLRTKGRLYVLVDVEPGASRDVANEAAEVLRDEYYYDLSAGIDVSLRRAVLAANKRARTKARSEAALHLACAVLCRNEMYTAKVGAGEVFVVRRARLFVPGTGAGELTDYAFRVQRPALPALGSESDVGVAIWREQAEPGDTLVLTVGRLVDVVGPEELKSSVLTLHPTASAQAIRERFLAAGAAGRAVPGVLVVEVSPLGAAPRLRPQAAPVAVEDPQVEAVAERIRERLDTVGAGWRGLGRRARQAARPLVAGIATAVAIVAALLPQQRPRLPRAAEVAAVRALRRRRVTMALAFALLLASSGVGVLAYVDFQEAREGGNAALELLRARQDVDAARTAAGKQPPDVSAARERLESAERHLDLAAASRRVDAGQLTDLRAQIAALRLELTNLVIDLARLDATSAPASIDYGQGDVLFVADPGAGRLWRVPTQQPDKSSALAQRGSPEGIGDPWLVALANDAVYTMDGALRLFRYEGSNRREVLIKDKKFTQPVDLAVFSNNIYILDRPSGQVWKYEPSADGQYSAPAIAYLEKPLAPGTARTVAVDGEIWVTNDGGEVLRYRRGTGAQALQLEFVIRWRGEPAQATAIQAKEGQGRQLWILDAKARRVIQLARDGAELARVALPAELPEPHGFVVVEEVGRIVSLHGTRLARTDVAR